MSVLGVLLNKALHLASYALSSRGKKVFELASKQVEQTQLKIFNDLLQNIDGSLSANNLGINAQRDLAWFQENVTDRKSTRLNSSHVRISYAVFCSKKKT